MELSPEIRQKIEEQKGELVRKAQNLLEHYPVWEAEDNKFGDRQLKNLLDVANASPCTEVVENFIKYQIGRDKDKEGWGAYKGFGFGLINTIRELEITSKGIILGNARAVNRPLEDEVKIRLARLFIGYLTRHFKFKRWQKENPENEEVPAGTSQEGKSS